MKGIIIRVNDFGTKDEQDVCLQSLLEAYPVKDTSKRQAGSTVKPKSHSYKYFVEIEGSKVIVCKTAFLSMHGVTDKRIKRLRHLKILNKNPDDLRGKGVMLFQGKLAKLYMILLNPFHKKRFILQTGF